MLEPADATLGLFRITPQDGVPVRVEGMDLCKNMTSQPLNLKEFADGRDASQRQDSFSNPPPPNQPFAGAPIEATDKVVAAQKNEFPDIKTFPSQPMNPEIRFPGSGAPLQVSGTADPLPSIAVGAGSSSVTAPLPANRTLLPSTQASVEYRVDQQGPSGVGKVQIYVTGDQGQSWQLLKEDVSKRSPLEVKMPGEGLFGINVVITNGNGFGGTAPRAAKRPPAGSRSTRRRRWCSSRKSTS